MRATESETLWSKIGIINEVSLMAKSVLIYGSGCSLQFLHLTGCDTSNENNDKNNSDNCTERQLTLNCHKVNGDGLKCFHGHGSLYIFAYSENCQSPFIYVKTYPSFDLIVKFDGEREGYKCLEFSESSLLFSLGEMPHYKVTAWNWRSMDKFAESSNELLYENQIIKCSYGRPMYLAQFGVGSRKLFIWDVFTVCKSTIFDKHEVKVDNLTPGRTFQSVCWSMDMVALFIIDQFGNIYTVDRDFYLELVVDAVTCDISRHLVNPSICWYHHGLTVSGPTQQIRHYKKMNALWICDAHYDTAPAFILNIISGRHEKCIGITDVSQLVTFGTTSDSLTYIKRHESNYTDIDIVNPYCVHFIAQRGRHHLDALEIATGKLISTITVNLTSDILALSTSPLYPYLVTAHSDGRCRFWSYYHATTPTELFQLHLSDFPLTSRVKFFESSRYCVCGNMALGEFFILRGLPASRIDVAVNVSVKRQVVDYTMVASQNMIRFFVIPITHNDVYAGNTVWRYCIVDNCIVNVKKYEFDDNSAATDCAHVFYRRIYCTKASRERDRRLYLVPLRARFFQLAELKRGSSVIQILAQYKTGHQMKSFTLQFTLDGHMISWGYDGFTFVRAQNETFDIAGVALAHHRNCRGVRRAICTATVDVIVSLGYGGVLIATKLPYNAAMPLVDYEHADPKLKMMFRHPTVGPSVAPRFVGKSWREIQRLQTVEREQAECVSERTRILTEFADIQRTLRDLVSANFEMPENKQLDLLEFYLDTQAYHRKQIDNKEICKQEDIYLRCLIVAQDKVADFIVRQYWDTMGVQWQNIMGIFSSMKATNYCLLPVNEAKQRRLQWIEVQRQIEQYLRSQDTFEPWQTMTKPELTELQAQRPPALKDDYTALPAILNTQADDNALLLVSNDANEQRLLETRIATVGKVSQLYIDVNPAHYRQRQLNTFYQCELQQAIAEGEVIKLKQNYNKCFQNTRSLKEREMYNIREKNERLRHIIAEFNYFSERKVLICIHNPEWDPIENVESDILQVSDDEVPIQPYVSPSEQQILDARAAEAERIRLLLLADDFRERALQAMMNGVLEVRWEDELKKDVPPPKCIEEAKSPEDFNEDDLRAIKEYEEKVALLRTEREKYKSLLEVEFVKLSVTLRDTIRKFNSKLYDCTKFKFYIDSGMNQENLLVNRQRWIQDGRVEIDEKERDILRSIKIYEKTVEENQTTSAKIQAALSECRQMFDTMQLKEKQLEKLYRKDFQDVPPVVQEQSYKLYRKRPKMSFRVITTATVLNELAKGVLTNQTTFAMTQECIDYLKNLELLDSAQGLPLAVDDTVWKLICKHRRARIEFEIRMRAAQIQMLEGESTVTTFQRRLQTQKEKIALLQSELDATRRQRIYLIHNKPFQLVLRRGLVEIPLSGDLFSDFTDAILVPQSEIQHVNRLIIDAGQLKLRTIERNLKFRRTIMQAEWEHTRLRMKINDFIEQKRDIENVKFTKEMQGYLKNKSLGRKQEIDSYEMEIELLAIAYENRIKDKRDKVHKIDTQLRAFETSNLKLNRIIQEINVDLCQFRLDKDNAIWAKERKMLEARMRAMLARNQLIERIQTQHNQILLLQTELELLRMRTFPSFKYRLLD